MYEKLEGICHYKKCNITIEDYLTDSGKIPTKCRKHYEAQKIREANRKPRNRNWSKERENRKINNLKKFKISQKKKQKQNRENKHSSFLNYRNKAKKFNRTFEIPENIFNLLLETKCFYCGIEPGYKNQNNKDNYFSSIDRVNNNIGYIINNVVPSCHKCNMIKKDYDYNIFIKQMEHIAIYWKSDFRILKYPNISGDIREVWYSKYKIEAKNRNYQFNIPEDIFYYFRDYCNCYICNKQSNKNHKNGIDRVNNNIGYKVSNILSCCGMCNIMKKNMKIKDFINHCDKIYKHQRIIRNI